MNMKQRMLAVIRGGGLDRVPFVQYEGLSANADGTPASREQIADLLGPDAIGYLRWTGMYAVQHPNCRWDSQDIEVDGLPGWRSTITTPAGSLTSLARRVPGVGAACPKEHFVKTLEDYSILMAWFRDAVVTPEPTSVRQMAADLGETGLPHPAVMRTPWQELWINWVSMMDLGLHVVDDPTRVIECMDVMGGVLMKMVDATLIAADGIDVPYVVVPDNLTAPLVGEPRFRRFILPYYRTIAARLAEKDIPMAVHMDGDLAPLWKAIGESGVKVIDSLSPPPDNDTSAAQAVALWPDIRLLLNFPSSVHLADEMTICRRACDILGQAGHTGRLQIQVSENTPPGAWRKSFPAIAGAIRDFGRP
jgi:hypothetical protein